MPLLAPAGAILAAGGTEGTDNRRLEVLFFGGDAYHRPPDRYRPSKSLMPPVAGLTDAEIANELE